MKVIRISFQTLAEILSEREMICHLMENILDEATRPWGVKVERVEIKVKTVKMGKHPKKKEFVRVSSQKHIFFVICENDTD